METNLIPLTAHLHRVNTALNDIDALLDVLPIYRGAMFTGIRFAIQTDSAICLVSIEGENTGVHYRSLIVGEQVPYSHIALFQRAVMYLLQIPSKHHRGLGVIADRLSVAIEGSIVH